MSNIEAYKKYFTKEYLMGPNSFRLLDELIHRRPDGVCFNRTLDLGCGYALTSLFIANETDAEHVYAFDLWIPATENYLRIRDMHKSTAITDELYSRINAGDTNQIITTLGLDTSMHTTETAEAIPENLPDYIKIAIKALIDSARAQ